MKIVELEAKKKDLKKELKKKPENSLAVLAQLQEVCYRLGVSESISGYYFAAKHSNTAREFKIVYMVFAKYINTLASNFFFAPSDEKKSQKVNEATEKFLSVITGVTDRANNSEWGSYEEFFNSFSMDSLSINIAFNEFRDNFIKIQ